MSFYDYNGNLISDIFDLSGNKITKKDYDEWDTTYQKAILDARDEWQQEYRSDNTIIPLILQTDEHRHYNSSNKPNFEYLGRAINWDEVSANVNLGDVCGAIYNTTDLNNMLSCLSPIPLKKQLHAVGNHDVWAKKTEGSSYAYSITDQWETLTGTYFNNSQFGTNFHSYDNRGNVSVYDNAHNVKYCILGCWYFGNTATEENQPYHAHRITTECMNYWIDMLSEKTECDLVVMSHIQPIVGACDVTYPAVDGSEEKTESYTYSGNGTLGHGIDLRQLISDRKHKRAGSITDADGVVHNYDFTQCTSDILCWLSGHAHEDCNMIVDGVPVIVFDAYGYDAEPFFMVNIHRDGSVNVWKIGEDSVIYNFQVNF